MGKGKKLGHIKYFTDILFCQSFKFLSLRTGELSLEGLLGINLQENDVGRDEATSRKLRALT